jgi:hypothetical protein
MQPGQDAQKRTAVVVRTGQQERDITYIAPNHIFVFWQALKNITFNLFARLTRFVRIAMIFSQKVILVRLTIIEKNAKRHF